MFNARIKQGEPIRVFPLSNGTALDICRSPIGVDDGALMEKKKQEGYL